MCSNVSFVVQKSASGAKLQISTLKTSNFNHLVFYIFYKPSTTISISNRDFAFTDG